MDLIFAVGWEGFIIPGIAFAIWIISSLAGANKNAPPNPNAGAKNLGLGNQPPLSDLERFFQEAKQRRAKPDSVPMASLYVEPETLKEKRRTPKNTSKRNKVQPLDVPFLVDEKPRAFVPSDIQLQTGTIKKVASESEVLPLSPATITKGSDRKFGSKTSPLITEALALLKGPKVIGSALVLQEILQPPLCLRRRQPR
ncbi:MAG: hypothetical protein CK551_05390 [Planctomycetaceae bacterium]|nr:hypothetical protein [Gemmataceae bacterium]PHX63571.1 MAG: hypothetical protein CK551_05390 [Planctomycetaceae bacterium]